MAQILGLGITHYPNLAADVNMSWRMQRALEDPAVPQELRAVENWPAAMQAQWGADRGRSHSDRHRQELIEQFRAVRSELDAFAPDFVLIWGDDQYENFQDDCVPAFCIGAYERMAFQPWKGYRRGRNVWNEPEEKTFGVRGHRAGGKYLAAALLDEGIDVAYAYKPLHHALGHAFANSVLFLDYDRKGFDYPLVPFSINAYGRWLRAGNTAALSPSSDGTLTELDPPAPAPWRCFDVGAAAARALERSPWRVALIASSSWSHGFLVPKHARLYPDVEADKRFYAALAQGDWNFWRSASLAQIEESGQHELLNWFCLAGAMHALRRQRPDYSTFLESWITNSDKVFAVFKPRA